VSQYLGFRLATYYQFLLELRSKQITLIFLCRIPLNDEFLTAFGKREKEYDELAGRKIEIDQTSLDVVDVYDSEDEGNGDGKAKAKINYSEISAGKVKVMF
jgi:hypothetical protein